MSKVVFPVLSFLLTFSQLSSAQNPVLHYLGEDWKETPADQAVFIEYHFEDKSVRGAGKVITRKTDSTLVSDIDYLNISKGLKHGLVIRYDSIGRIWAKESYSYNKKQGILESFYPDGTRRRQDRYRNNRLISGKCFSTTGEDTAYYTYEKAPQFPGGIPSLVHFMKKNTRYPPEAQKNGEYGIVVIRFLVNTEGKLEDIIVYKPQSESLNQEALRVVHELNNAFRWEPGIVEGEAVSYTYFLPIRFHPPH